MSVSACQLKGDLLMLEESLMLYRVGSGYVVASW